MRKLIGVTAVALLVVAFFAPTGVQAAAPVQETCAESTEFSQPSSGAYTRSWKPYSHRVVVKGSVTATLVGQCRGFVSGVITVDVQRPNGKTSRRTEKFTNLEFKNGFQDTGQPFTFTFAPLYSRTLRKPGTCVTVTVEWGPWFFNTNERIPGTDTKKSQEHGCYRAKQ